jgi:hypothetical protein
MSKKLGRRPDYFQRFDLARAPVSRGLELPGCRYSATIFLQIAYSFD